MTLLAENRTVLVTGGAGRLGRAIVDAFLREGATVVVADNDPGRLREALADLSAPGRIFGVSGDCSEEADVLRMVEEAEEHAGRLDTLVNAHGVFPNLPLLEMTVDQWDRPFVVNVRGTMLTCRTLARLWVARGVKGSIVNISSGASRSARRGGSHYTGSKAAVNMLTEVLAIELGEYGIRINAVLPGLIMDDVLTAEDADKHPYANLMLKQTPLGRTGMPSDVAEAVVFLSSDRSPWTTGALLEITGGSHCGRTHMPYSRQMR